MVTIDHSILDARTAAIVRGLDSMPQGAGNPILDWFQGDYTPHMASAYRDRPLVQEGRTWQGEWWPRPKEQYIRKTDGVVVPVEGGVPRAILGKGMFGAHGLHSRLGTVTRAGSASIRLAGDLTPAEIAAGFHIVKVGQVFSGATVKGKLRTDGSRVKGTDPQLGTRGDGLLADWLSAPPLISNRGKVVTKTSNKRYAAKVAEKRNFYWPRQARDELVPKLVRRIKVYIVDLWKGAA